jgi:hypothetical protein
LEDTEPVDKRAEVSVEQKLRWLWKTPLVLHKRGTAKGKKELFDALLQFLLGATGAPKWRRRFGKLIAMKKLFTLTKKGVIGEQRCSPPAFFSLPHVPAYCV